MNGVAIHVDTRAIERFGERLGRAPSEINARLSTGFARAGQLVAGKARGGAVPAGTTVSSFPLGIHGARIHASNVHGGGTAALEHHGDPGTFRHPVFGLRSVWVSQKAQPFLHPALRESESEVRAVIEDAMREVLDTLSG